MSMDKREDEEISLFAISYAVRRFILLLMKIMIAQAANIRVAPTGTAMKIITFLLLSSFLPNIGSCRNKKMFVGEDYTVSGEDMGRLFL